MHILVSVWESDEQYSQPRWIKSQHGLKETTGVQLFIGLYKTCSISQW